MPTITLITTINAPIDRCFALASNIDFHSYTTANTKERAIAGVTSGQILLNQTVTWQATHFGVQQKLTSKITAFDAPYYFVDEQVKGVFKRIHHQHIFEYHNDITTMKDIFNFESPFGVLGRCFNALVLKNYMKKFLQERNVLIKQAAESELWKKFVSSN